MYGPELFEALRSMQLPRGHYAVFGSGPLLVHGIIDSVNDLDVICRGPVWKHVQAIGVKIPTDDGVLIVSTHDGSLTFGVGWRYGDFDIDALIEEAEMLEGLPFVPLRHVATFKRLADRPKDREHLAALQRWRDWAAVE